MERTERKKLIEALLFAKPDPLSAKEIQRVTGWGQSEIEETLAELLSDYQERGIQLVEVAEGYQFRTRPEFVDYLSELLHPPVSVHLSRAALETLAIIAYRQPIMRREIERIRGVDCDGVLATLTERGLIDEAGRGEGIGRPLLYVTTPLFLQVFGLKNLVDLPPMIEMESLRGL